MTGLVTSDVAVPLSPFAAGAAERSLGLTSVVARATSTSTTPPTSVVPMISALSSAHGAFCALATTGSRMSMPPSTTRSALPRHEKSAPSARGAALAPGARLSSAPATAADASHPTLLRGVAMLMKRLL